MGTRTPRGRNTLWRVSETFEAQELKQAGAGGYVLIRGVTAFSLDHMFGF